MRRKREEDKGHEADKQGEGERKSKDIDGAKYSLVDGVGTLYDLNLTMSNFVTVCFMVIQLNN